MTDRFVISKSSKLLSVILLTIIGGILRSLNAFPFIALTLSNLIFGTIIILTIYSFYGNRNNLSYEKLLILPFACVIGGLPLFFICSLFIFIFPKLHFGFYPLIYFIYALIKNGVYFLFSKNISVINTYLLNYSDKAFSFLPEKLFVYIDKFTLWCIFKGFVFCLILSIVLALLPNKLTQPIQHKTISEISHPSFRFVYFSVMFSVIFAFIPFRFITDSLYHLILSSSVASYSALIKNIILACTVIALSIIYLVAFKKNILNRDLPVPFKVKSIKFSKSVLPIYLIPVLLIIIFYFEQHIFQKVI